MSPLATPAKSCGYIFPSLGRDEIVPNCTLPTEKVTGRLLQVNVPLLSVVPFLSPQL